MISKMKPRVVSKNFGRTANKKRVVGIMEKKYSKNIIATVLICGVASTVAFAAAKKAV